MSTSMHDVVGSTSVWRATTAPSQFAQLEGEVHADVVIVGAGITGVTLAALLADAGQSVVLLEARDIGFGSTGNSTGNLYQVVGEGLHGIDDKWGAQVMRQVAESRGEAIDDIERNVRRFDIDCSFRRCDLHWYGTSTSAHAFVDHEYRAAPRAGLAASMVAELPSTLRGASGPMLVLQNQAQFNPLAYVRALAQQAAKDGCRIYERSAALHIDTERRIVHTTRGQVSTRNIVLATHSPKGFHVVQAEMVPNREYALATRCVGTAWPDGIYWGRGPERASVRNLHTADGDYLIVVGQEHKTGQHPAHDSMTHLEEMARKTLGVEKPDFRWSAQNYRSADALPYIGRIGADIHIATGFAADGLTYGALAAAIIAEQLQGREHRFGELYKANRVTPLKSAKGVIEETTSVVKVLVKDYLTHPQLQEVSKLAPGSGAIVKVENDSLAAYRDPAGTLHIVSPVCTHLKCMVHWNDMETSWDCPCHGSRFAPDGSVIEGPAIEPLKRKELPAG